MLSDQQITKINEIAVSMAHRQIESKPPFFSQIPDSLVKDSRISNDAKSCYMLLHSYCSKKNLTKDHN